MQNIRGQGIDIHLLGLKEQAKIMELPLDLFDSQAFKIANYFGLSTSQVGNKYKSVLKMLKYFPYPEVKILRLYNYSR